MPETARGRPAGVWGTELFEDANTAISRARSAAIKRRAQRGLYPAMIQAIDDLLFELEELNLQGVIRVPGPLRERSQALLSMVPAEDPEAVRVRQKVVGMMDSLFNAQEILFRAKDPSRPAYTGDDEEEIQDSA
jgi:hypothetical protein